VNLVEKKEEINKDLEEAALSKAQKRA